MILKLAGVILADLFPLERVHEELLPALVPDKLSVLLGCASMESLKR